MLDPDQLEQMLINLLRNAVEAALEPSLTQRSMQTDRPPRLILSTSRSCHGWELADRDLVLTIDDNGPGLLNPSNAFVPFYTTKPAGSGIGLVLCRQIAEAHGGSIELLNQSDKRGCQARVVLPRSEAI